MDALGLSKPKAAFKSDCRGTTALQAQAFSQAAKTNPETLLTASSTIDIELNIIQPRARSTGACNAQHVTLLA